MKRHVILLLVSFMCFSVNVSAFASSNTVSTTEASNATSFSDETIPERDDIPTTITPIYDLDIDTGNHHYEEDIPEDCTCYMCEVINNMYQINEMEQATTVEDEVIEKIFQNTTEDSYTKDYVSKTSIGYTNSHSYRTETEKALGKETSSQSVVSEANTEATETATEAVVDNANIDTEKMSLGWVIGGIAIALGCVIVIVKRKIKVNKA